MDHNQLKYQKTALSRGVPRKCKCRSRAQKNPDMGNRGSRMLMRSSRPALLLAAAATQPVPAPAPSRQMSYEKLSTNMSLMHAEGIEEKGGGVGQRPLVVMLPWLLAKRPLVVKYAKLYTERGIDVLSVKSNPGHLLRPTKGSQVVAGELLRYLKELPGRAPLLIHGFSVGGYLWGEALVQLQSQPELRETLEKRFVGQIWDSVVELTEAPAGLARSVFPRSTMMQVILEKMITTYMTAFRNVTTRHYELSSQHFHRHPIHCPALLLLSESDPLGTVSANQILVNNWKKIDVPTYVKIWEGSPHVGHFRMYRAEYEEQVDQFLLRLGVIGKTS